MTDALYNLRIQVGECKSDSPIEYWDEITIKNDPILAHILRAYMVKLLDLKWPIKEPIRLYIEDMDTNETRTMDYSVREIESLTERT